MWFFLGCCVIALVLWYWGMRFHRIFSAAAIIFERALNEASVRAGYDPITTREDEEMYR